MALLAIFVVGAVMFNQRQTKEGERVAEVNRAALIRMHSPAIGPANAPVVIVKFLDPACETCRAFYPLVKQLIAEHPDKIRLVLRYAPFHNGSDKVVTVLEAARRQGKLWPALEALLASQDEWSPQHTPPEISRIVEQDLADAKTLNVTKTPGFFVNGRPMPSFGADQLNALLNDALAVVPQ